MAGLKRTIRLSTPTAGAERIGVVSDQDHLRTEYQIRGKWEVGRLSFPSSPGTEIKGSHWYGEELRKIKPNFQNQEASNQKFPGKGGHTGA